MECHLEMRIDMKTILNVLENRLNHLKSEYNKIPDENLDAQIINLKIRKELSYLNMVMYNIINQEPPYDVTELENMEKLLDDLNIDTDET